MRSALLAGVLVLLALALGGPAAGDSSAACGETSCGVPSCYDPKVRARPGMTRALLVQCSGVVSATLVSGPAHGTISNVTYDWYGLHFDIRPDDDSPRTDEAVFELTGQEGTTEQHVSIEVIPTSENSAPYCYGDKKTQRSDGTGPVEVYMTPYCYDPDGDEMVMRGGPPGVHPLSPKSVPAGSGDSNWQYRTATFSGTEVSTIWATDVLGARSEDARLEVTVGPGVERPPECRPNGGWSNEGPLPVWSRPGAIRHFGIWCQDPDGDPFTTRLSSPPARGQMPLFLESDATYSGYFGAERWIEATYVPTDDSLEPDPFSVTASGAAGDGPETRMAITPRPLPENGGGGCGWGPGGLTVDVPGELTLNCTDDDGDPLSLEVLSEPRHGVAAPAVLTPSRYGSTDITIPYVPGPGYEGYDCMRVKVSDGHGLVFDMTIDIWIRKPYVPDPTQWVPPLPPLPPLPTGPGAPPVRETVEQALGTSAIKRVQNAGGVQVWARSHVSRRDLVRFGHAPGLVVICTKRCQIRSGSALATSGRRVRASRLRKALVAAQPRQAQVLSLSVARSERRALRHAHKPKANFSVTVHPVATRARSLKRSLPVRR